MTCVENLAQFVVGASNNDLSESARDQLKIRILDSLGCAIGAVEGPPVRLVRCHVDDFDGNGKCSLVGGGLTSPDRAAFYNGALVRYLDFNDSYLAEGETCHPSDNLAPVLAAAEYSNASGKDLMTALAVAYQVQCRLSEVAPVRAKGFDHTTQGSYAVAAGVSRALGLDLARTSNAIAISGTAFNALRVTRTGKLSHWKGLAYPNTAACCTNATFLAMRGITGPLEVFEGDKGFMDAVAGFFEIDWSAEDLERVKRTIIKKHNAEIHSQTTIESVLELQRRYQFSAADVQHVDVEIFDVAYHIIGGGEEGDKTQAIDSKERADHSLPYILAVVLLDRQVMPEQYESVRILRDDVQWLLKQVTIRPNASYSKSFPGEMPCRVRIMLHDGRLLTKEMRDYPGFYSQPMSWEMALQKFEFLAQPYTTAEIRRGIAETVANLEEFSVSDLTHKLRQVRIPPHEENQVAFRVNNGTGDEKGKREGT